MTPVSIHGTEKIVLEFVFWISPETNSHIELCVLFLELWATLFWKSESVTLNNLGT